MQTYTLLTKVSTLTAETEEARLAIINEQWAILESLGYEQGESYEAHYFNSAFFDEGNEYGEISDLIERLAIKDRVDLVRFEDGKIGFVAYYSGHENGFELLESYKTKRERVNEYLTDLETNYKHDFIALWAVCCDLCGWMDLDKPSRETMTDIVMDYNTSLFDEGLKKILKGED